MELPSYSTPPLYRNYGASMKRDLLLEDGSLHRKAVNVNFKLGRSDESMPIQVILIDTPSTSTAHLTPQPDLQNMNLSLRGTSDGNYLATPCVTLRGKIPSYDITGQAEYDSRTGSARALADWVVGDKLQTAGTSDSGGGSAHVDPKSLSFHIDVRNPGDDPSSVEPDIAKVEMRFKRASSIAPIALTADLDLINNGPLWLSGSVKLTPMLMPMLTSLANNSRRNSKSSKSSTTWSWLECAKRLEMDIGGDLCLDPRIEGVSNSDEHLPDTEPGSPYQLVRPSRSSCVSALVIDSTTTTTADRAPVAGLNDNSKNQSRESLATLGESLRKADKPLGMGFLGGDLGFHLLLPPISASSARLQEAAETSTATTASTTQRFTGTGVEAMLRTYNNWSLLQGGLRFSGISSDTSSSIGPQGGSFKSKLSSSSTSPISGSDSGSSSGSGSGSCCTREGWALGIRADWLMSSLGLYECMVFGSKQFSPQIRGIGCLRLRELSGVAASDPRSRAGSGVGVGPGLSGSGGGSGGGGGSVCASGWDSRLMHSMEMRGQLCYTPLRLAPWMTLKTTLVAVAQARQPLQTTWAAGIDLRLD